MYVLGARDDIHTQVATLNVNMTLESEPPSPLPPLSFNVKCGNKYSFVSKEDEKVIFLKLS